MVRLCLELKRHKRAVLVVGITGRQWGMKDPEGWDAMVSQLLGIAHSMGTMAIDGQKYYSRMTQHTDGWHFAQEQATIDILVELVQDAINAVFAAKPLGSLAVTQRLQDEDVPSATAAAVVVPVSTVVLSATAGASAAAAVPMADVTSATAGSVPMADVT